MDKQIAENEGTFVELLNQEMKELQESQSQIEELAKALCPSYENKKDCETCPTEWCQAKEYAVMAICNGYRKIPENAVVLTRKEKLKEVNDLVKEKLKKFAERVKMAFYYEFDELIPSIMADKIDEIAKELEGENGD